MPRRHDARGRSIGANAPRRLAALNGPPEGEPWAWLTREMLESEAFRSLSAAAYRVLFRLMIEHMAHAGTENGNLIATVKQLETYGIRRESVRHAVQELVATGFVRVTPGRFAAGNFKAPSRYRLTWLPTPPGAPATNEWKAPAKKT